MSETTVEVRPGAYADSVALLQVSREVGGTAGVLAAQVAMATPLNVEVLTGMGFDVPPCSPNDMVVALHAEDPDSLARAQAAVDAALTGGRRRDASAVEVPARTTASAVRRAGPSAAGVALVSVPGEHAAVEAVDALDQGLDVMIFSDNVPVEQEVALKAMAADRDLLVMGPDCGTAVIGGVGLGFANVTPSGEVGIVAASGTGCQQLLCLLAAAGVGVGAALGVGGRDLSRAVGGASTRQALARLDADPSIAHIVLVSKPPAPEVAAELEAYAGGLATPVHLALLGAGQPDLTRTAESLMQAMGRDVPSWPRWGAAQAGGPLAGSAGGSPAGGRWLRGLFVGGTLCDEAMLVAEQHLGPIRSNIPLRPELAHDPTSQEAPDAHTMVDFGDDAMTQGRAHPMIDPTLRLQHLERSLADPGTGVVLLDVVLGHGAEADPAAGIVPVLRAGLAAVRAEGRTVPVVVACVGTEDDPQVLSRQAEHLADAGAEVHLSNAEAVGRAVELVGAGVGAA